MGLSFYEAKQRLLSGQPLTWAKFGDNKAGSVHLASAGARRLFHFLLTCEQSKVADAHESLFDDLIAAWELETFDPATQTEQSGTATNAGPWRLARLETSGFGGLNQVLSRLGMAATRLKYDDLVFSAACDKRFQPDFLSIIPTCR